MQTSETAARPSASNTVALDFAYSGVSVIVRNATAGNRGEMGGFFASVERQAPIRADLGMCEYGD